ncbi:BBP7 family outer membrane beta-barrel protein [Blastopirellula marina]|nr:BBP7 family outer membrane beta-barrel protein [Blastopirellula marina]
MPKTPHHLAALTFVESHEIKAKSWSPFVMKTFLTVPCALAGLLSATALFAQTPVNQYQPATYRPGATYFAEPPAPAKLWGQPTTNVSYSKNQDSALEPIPGDKSYLDALEGKGQAPEAKPAELPPPAMPSLDGTPIDSSFSSSCCEGNYSGPGTAVYGDCCVPCSQWFAYGGGLIMNRDLEKEVWLSNDSLDYSRQLMGTHDAGMDWTGGYEVRLGKYFAASGWAVEGRFWALRDTTDFSITNAGLAGQLDTPLDVNFQGLSYDNGVSLQNATAYFNNAMIHRLRRSSDFYNVELNFFQNPNLYACTSGASNFSVGVLGGLRYFRFAEGMSFSSDTVDTVFDGNPNEINYNIDVANNLIGPQVGFLGSLNHGAWNVSLGTKLGLYGNAITHHSQVYGSAGNAIVDNVASPNNGREFDLNGSRSRISFLGELDLSTSYRLFQNFTITGGYRAVAVSGVALSADQIPQNFEDFAIIEHTQAASDLILHGAYFGAEFVW